MRTTPQHGQHGRHLLIVLAKYPRPGTVKTRLATVIGDAAAAAVYEAFLADLAPRVIPDAGRVRFDVCWLYVCADCSEHEFQRLIERLQGRVVDLDGSVSSGSRTYYVGHTRPSLTEHQVGQLRWADAMGYAASVVITTDSPHLQRSTIDDAFDRLREHDLVIGPVVDGGYYLLGMRGYHPVLERVTMSTDHVAHDIETNAQACHLEVAKLDVLSDVDTVADLQLLVRTTSSTRHLCQHTWGVLQRMMLVDG